jgi:DivIVA domain-containing protein
VTPERHPSTTDAPDDRGTHHDFVRTTGLTKGYDRGQVDAFLARALSGRVSSVEIRAIGFDARLGGYRMDQVDRALDQLEDDAVTAERGRQRHDLGERAFVQEVTSQAQVLRARLARRHGDRFARGGAWEPSYDVEQVDNLCDDVAEYFDGATALSPEDLRGAVFSTRRGGRGYSESAVDRFIDRVVALMGRVQD